MGILDIFLDRLIKLEPRERRHFLHGVYKQVIVSKKGNQAKGPYKDGIETSSNEEKQRFVLLLTYNMRSYGLEIQSRRLLAYYNLESEFEEFQKDDTIKSLRKLKEMYELPRR